MEDYTKDCPHCKTGVMFPVGNNWECNNLDCLHDEPNSQAENAEYDDKI